MLRITLAVCLVVLCTAQTRPKIPESFASKVVIEVHRGRQAEFGEGIFDSDSSSLNVVRNSTFKSEQGIYETFYTLQLYRQHMEYHERPDGGREECSNEPIRGDFEPPFGWVQNAKYNGSEVIEHKTLDVWYIRVATSEFAVGVTSDDPNTPVVFLERSHQGEIISLFTEFTPGTPPSTVFDVPRNCR